MNIKELLRLLAERDAEIERLRAALKPQQAASVGGEREAFEAWAASVGYHTERDMFQREKYQSTLTWELWRVWQARAALSPAGGGVVMPERKPLPNEYGSKYQNRYEAFCQDLARAEGYNEALDEAARLNAKPQANSQWLAPEDELNVALVLGHAEDLRLQGHPERADALVQAAEEYVSILAEVQAAQNGIRARAGEL